MKHEKRKSVSWGGKAVMVALIAALVLPTLFMGPVSLAQAKAQPALLAMAAEQPQARVRVIAQMADPAANVDSLVEGLDGEIVADLHIINAFAAELSAAAARQLATSQEVRWVSLDGPIEQAGKKPKGDQPEEEPAVPENFFLDTMNVRPVWDMGYRGQGVTVAVIDSGVQRAKDLQVDSTTAKPDSRVLEQLTFNSRANETGDVTGHGTHVAGIIGGSGWESGYLYTGVAPEVNLLSLKVSDDNGLAYESDVVEAMQWVFDNKDAYNIRVVNLSLNSTEPASYHSSPMDAAAEILWFNGVVVVAAAGNSGGNEMYDTINSAPANDPFLITVGAMDEKGTSKRNDDSVPTFSAWGWTYEGSLKPEIYAPGTDIISVLAASSSWDSAYPEREVDDEYFRISGTSMAAPMVSGAAALLLQAEPDLTADQVKYRLINSAGWTSGWRYLDVYAALTTPTSASANTGLVASQLLWSGDEPIAWNSVSWNSVSWNSVSWNSVSWNSVSWNSVSWNSVSWNN